MLLGFLFLLSFPRLGKFSSIIHSNIPSAPLSLLMFWDMDVIMF